MLIGLVLVPLATPIVLWSRLFGRGSILTREDVACYIRSGLDLQDDGHWDDFEQMRIRDPELEAIRQRAIAVKFPLNEADREKLNNLLRTLAP